MPGAGGPTHDRTRPGTPPLDRVVFQSSTVTVAAFRCPTAHPQFRDSGAIQNHLFVFPRQSVELRHEDQSAFVADPNVVTLYNRGQRYSRHPVSPLGDHCEWFAVEPEALLDAVRTRDPRVDDHPDRPFRWAYGPCPPRTYLAQRALFDQLGRGEPHDSLFVEERVLDLLAQVLAAVYGFLGPAPRSAPPISTRQREAAEHARRLLGERLGDSLCLKEIARAVDLSPFHLCRAFRAATGTSLHAYRNQMRLRSALGRLTDGSDITEIALDLGYSSHSHFTESFRRLFGTTPSRVRGSREP
jgi:AraC family transcriptional regulator